MSMLSPLSTMLASLSGGAQHNNFSGAPVTGAPVPGIGAQAPSGGNGLHTPTGLFPAQPQQPQNPFASNPILGQLFGALGGSGRFYSPMGGAGNFPQMPGLGALMPLLAQIFQHAQPTSGTGITTQPVARHTPAPPAHPMPGGFPGGFPGRPIMNGSPVFGGLGAARAEMM